jgi:hypothetical protein
MISGPIFVMHRATQILCLLTSVGFLVACAPKAQPLKELPDDVFEREPEASGSLSTVGQLAEAHVENTFALRRANNKLTTICIAVERCENEGLK